MVGHLWFVPLYFVYVYALCRFIVSEREQWASADSKTMLEHWRENAEKARNPMLVYLADRIDFECTANVLWTLAERWTNKNRFN